MRAIEYGKPAEWAAQQKWKRRGKAAKSYGTAAAVVLIVLAVAAMALLLDEVNTTVRVVAVLLVALLGGAFAYTQFNTGKEAWTRSEHARIGVDSERQVRRVVRKHPHVAAVYGAKMGARQGDVDLILVDNKLSLAAIEIKTGSGQVSVNDRTVRAGRKTMPRDPLGQCMKAANRLEQAAGVPTTPVLCIPGMTNKPFTTNEGVLVCSAKHLIPAIEHYGDRAFSVRQEAEDACSGIWNRHLQFA